MERETILIAGGTGLIGSQLVKQFSKDKYQLKILSRSKYEDTPDVSYYQWDTQAMTIEEGATDADYIINFTGAGIADKRWTDERKKVLIDSRVNPTMLLKQQLDETGHRPKAYISASAIGFYGDRGIEVLTEESQAGGDEFLVECCKKWEAAAMALAENTDRLVINRIGVVLSTEGGALPKILMTKAIGVYNYFGNGKMYYSWIHIDDVCNVFMESVTNSKMQGVYNAVAPEPLTNKEFTKEIKEAMGGGVLLPAPVFGLRLALGEMANVVLNSSRVLPARLQKLNFKYRYADLQEAIKSFR